MDSIWIEGGQAAGECLRGDVEADVAVVGAGITGVAAALRLAAAGRRVVVLDARRAGAGNTGRSTGNLYATVSSGLAKLRGKWNDADATLAVVARARAIDWIEQTARELGIDCAFRRVPLHQCVLDGASQELGMLRDEHEAARALGLGAAWGQQVDGWPLRPAAVHTLPGQAHFNPWRFVSGAVAALRRQGVPVYEHSRVIDIDADAGVVTTPEGRVRAGHVLLATHTPMGINLLQTKMEVCREYGVAAPLEGRGPSDASVWVHDGKWSLRTHEADGQRWLVIVGGKHKTGEGGERGDGWYDALRAWGRDHLGLRGYSHAWSAQQYASADGLPYIGRSGHGRVLVATGMGADGLVWGAVAGEVVDTLVRGPEGDDDPLARLLRPRRLAPLKSAKSTLKENATVARHMLGDRIEARRDDAGPDDVPRGGGRLLKIDGEVRAVHRTEGGELIALSAVCPHMKCYVKWNGADGTWDCPCHGSRFDVEGRVIEGPSLEDLQRLG